jgi:glutamate--cysteine ligase
MDEVYDLLHRHPRSNNRWIGLEVERLGLAPDGHTLRYKPEMKVLLETLVAEKDWRRDYEVDGNLLGIQKNLHSITLEPAAQFETSLAPRKTIFEIEAAQKEIDASIRSLELAKDWEFLSIGVNPWETPEDFELLPSPRYALMDQYFRTNGTRGREMMRLTTGLQINLDFSNEAEGIEMMRASFGLAPYLSSLFSNSPYFHGGRSKALSERHLIWRGMDPKRGGFLDFIFDSGFSLKQYADHISAVPLMYCYDENGKVHDPKGKALKDLTGKCSENNALAAMRQIFTEVRFKPCCVELRYFDELPEDLRYGATALVVGLLYDDENRKFYQDKFVGAKVSALEKLMYEGALRGLQVEEIYNFLKETLRLSEKGLKRRGFGEEKFLAPVENLIRLKKTPADLLIEKYGDAYPK